MTQTTKFAAQIKVAASGNWMTHGLPQTTETAARKLLAGYDWQGEMRIVRYSPSDVTDWLRDHGAVNSARSDGYNGPFDRRNVPSWATVLPVSRKRLDRE